MTVVPSNSFVVDDFTFETTKFTAYDYNGLQEPSKWSEYFDDKEAVIFVVRSSSLHDDEQVHKTQALLQSVLHSEQMPHTVPVLVIVNQQEEQVLLTEEAVATMLKVKQCGLSIDENYTAKPTRVFFCNAMVGTGVTTAMHWLVSQIRPHKHAHAKKQQQ